jgi:hypothetical protein
VIAVKHGNEELMVLARDMNLWFSNSPGLLEEGDTQKAHEQSMRGEGFVISQNQSLKTDVRVGDQLRLETPKGPLIRPVVGIVEFYYVEKGTVFMDRKLYKEYWGDNSVDLILLNLEPGVDRALFKTEINRAMASEQRAFIYTSE